MVYIREREGERDREEREKERERNKGLLCMYAVYIFLNGAGVSGAHVQDRLAYKLQSKKSSTIGSMPSVCLPKQLLIPF